MRLQPVAALPVVRVAERDLRLSSGLCIPKARRRLCLSSLLFSSMLILVVNNWLLNACWLPLLLPACCRCCLPYLSCRLQATQGPQPLGPFAPFALHGRVPLARCPAFAAACGPQCAQCACKSKLLGALLIKRYCLVRAGLLR